MIVDALDILVGVFHFYSFKGWHTNDQGVNNYPYGPNISRVTMPSFFKNLRGNVIWSTANAIGPPIFEDFG